MSPKSNDCQHLSKGVDKLSPQNGHRQILSETEYISPEDPEALINSCLGDETDTFCCFGLSRLQWLARPVLYLLVVSLTALVQGLFFTYSNATLSSVEKDFGLSSKLSGFTTTGNDVVQLIVSVPLAFLASGGNRPRWLGMGMLVAAGGCFVAVIPHFALGGAHSSVHNPSQQINANVGMGVCDPLNETLSCQLTSHLEETSTVPVTSNAVVALFLIAQMMAGVGSVLFYTVGHSYLDEAVSKTKAPIFLSISGAVRLLGPVSGYALASWALKFAVRSHFDSPQVSHGIHDFTPRHPRWVGAWWLGYLIIGSGLLAISWLLFLFPKMLPQTRIRRERRLRLLAIECPDKFRQHIRTLRPTKCKWTDLFASLKRLFGSAVYRLLVLNQMLFWFAFFGYITFKSKYLEHQFRLSASQANQYIAGVALLAALLGWLGTGAALSYLKPRPKGVIVFMALLSAISCLCHVGQSLLWCDHGQMHGLESALLHSRDWTTQAGTQAFQGEPISGNNSLVSCDTECACAVRSFSPVCRNSTDVFFNACFQKCDANDQNTHQTSVELTSGFCTSNCPQFVYYLILSVVAKMASAASRIPVNVLLLRYT